VLDGEIVCLDSQGKPQFSDLLFRRVEPVFYAFDLLWDEHLSTIESVHPSLATMSATVPSTMLREWLHFWK
jgi:hypothetical protein